MNTVNIKENINNICKIIKSNLCTINGSLVKRRRKIDFSDVFYFLCKRIYFGESYQITVSDINIEKKVCTPITTTSFAKKRKLLLDSEITKINNEILKYIYKDNKPRILAVDGTHVYLNKKLKNDGFPLSGNQTYCNGLISCIYDVEKGITINYTLVNDSNERGVFLQQLQHLKKGDTVVFDRGYFSIELAKILSEKGINFVFRLKTNINMARYLIKNNIGEYNTAIKTKGKVIPVRCIRYSLHTNKKENDNFRYPKDGYYYICTNLSSCKKIDDIKKIYHDRWSIETSFRTAKYNMTLSNITSKNIGNVKQDIAIHNFILLLAGYLCSSVSIDLKKKTKINFKNFLKQLCNHLRLFIYKKIHYKQINKILSTVIILSKVTYYFKLGRHYKRIRIKPHSKWGLFGNIFAYK
jgi:hypothetical protein